MQVAAAVAVAPWRRFERARTSPPPPLYTLWVVLLHFFNVHSRCRRVATFSTHFHPFFCVCLFYVNMYFARKEFQLLVCVCFSSRRGTMTTDASTADA